MNLILKWNVLFINLDKRFLIFTGILINYQLYSY